MNSIINIGRTYVVEGVGRFSNKDFRAWKAGQDPEKLPKVEVEYAVSCDITFPTPTEEQVEKLVEFGFNRLASVKAASLAAQAEDDPSGVCTTLKEYFSGDGWSKTLDGEREKAATKVKTPADLTADALMEDVFKKRAKISAARASFLTSIGLDGIKTKKDAMAYVLKFHKDGNTAVWQKELALQTEKAEQETDEL